MHHRDQRYAVASGNFSKSTFIGLNQKEFSCLGRLRALQAKQDDWVEDKLKALQDIECLADVRKGLVDIMYGGYFPTKQKVVGKTDQAVDQLINRHVKFGA